MGLHILGMYLCRVHWFRALFLCYRNDDRSHGWKTNSIEGATSKSFCFYVLLVASSFLLRDFGFLPNRDTCCSFRRQDYYVGTGTKLVGCYFVLYPHVSCWYA